MTKPRMRVICLLGGLHVPQSLSFTSGERHRVRSLERACFLAIVAIVVLVAELPDGLRCWSGTVRVAKDYGDEFREERKEVVVDSRYLQARRSVQCCNGLLVRPVRLLLGPDDNRDARRKLHLAWYMEYLGEAGDGVGVAFELGVNGGIESADGMQGSALTRPGILVVHAAAVPVGIEELHALGDEREMKSSGGLDGRVVRLWREYGLHVDVFLRADMIPVDLRVIVVVGLGGLPRAAVSQAYNMKTLPASRQMRDGSLYRRFVSA